MVDTGDGTAVVEMTPTGDMANHSGVVHGGIISALADSAMGRSLRTLKPGVTRAMSFDLKLSFINAAKIGETLRATGHVIHAGRRTAVSRRLCRSLADPARIRSCSPLQSCWSPGCERCGNARGAMRSAPARPHRFP